MIWNNFTMKSPPSAGRYLIVVKGHYYENVEISYYDGNSFKVEEPHKVTKWYDLPSVEDELLINLNMIKESLALCVKGKETINLDDWNLMVEFTPTAAKVIASSFSCSLGEFRKLVSTREFLVDDILRGILPEK